MIQKLDINQTPDITSQNISKIKALFPEVITETKNEQGEMVQAIDFELLKQKLATDIVDGSDERYRLDWPGKRASLLKANTPISKTLRPVRKESVDFDTTQNLFIEGDNFEALKILQESYLGKVKMIYIDPPYNTGKDFVYSDNFTQDKAEYDEEIEAVDEEGNKMFRENTRTNPRFHSDWLSMMYERLIIARDLLRDDGVIFVSIGVEEVANLKSIMNEVYGEDNFIEIFSWVKTSTPPALSTKSRKTNEYIICYEKNWNNTQYNGELLDGGDQPLLNSGNSVRELKFPKEAVYFNEQKFANGPLASETPDRVALKTDIEIVDGYSNTDFVLEGEFKWTQDFLNEEIAKGTKFIIKTEKLAIRFIRAEEGYKRPTNFIKEKITSPLINKTENGVGTNENASSALIELMGGDYFDYPKPISLIKYLLNFVCQDDDIVLDFFAGSATTMQAVWDYNAVNETKLRAILVQIAEPLDPNSASNTSERKKIEDAIDFLGKLRKPHNIAELARERIRRAAAKIKTDYAEQLAKRATPLDTGFRTYKVADTIYNDVAMYPHDLKQESLLSFADNIKAEKSPEDILTAVMLHLGLTLDLPIATKTIGKNTIFNVADGALVACFDTDMDFAVVADMADMKPLRAVFRDASFASDQDRINLETTFKQRSPETRVSVI